MGEIFIKDKEIAVPGQILAEGMDYLPAGGAFREGEKIIASQVGLVNVHNRLVKLIPLNGRYVPKENDVVIGQIKDINIMNWFIDIGYANDAALTLKEATDEYIDRGADLTQYFNFGEYIVTRIIHVSKLKNIDLTMKGPGLRKLTEGRIIKITPAKVPRVIGKQGSMISLIKEATGCKIIVGQNGLIWIAGENPQSEMLAEEVIKLIEAKSHISGLTEQVKAFLDKKVSNNV